MQHKIERNCIILNLTKQSEVSYMSFIIDIIKKIVGLFTGK
ncbi:hypothetical protein ACW1CB_12160 [Staphylococcus xylosus]|nr:hypothetical protein [Staphylococcus xylosus]AID43736.1 hypothetical protein SXYLSMQ121_2305 [Staphylococcus xylosus]